MSKIDLLSEPAWTRPMEIKGKTRGPETFKAFPAKVLNIDDDQGIVEAYVSIMGNIDDGDDIIHPNAFTKTLAENGNRIKVLDSHNNRSTLSVIGRPLEIREVGKESLPQDLLMAHPEVEAALYTKTQYLLSVPEGKGCFERIKAGMVSEYSIGFDVLDQDMSKIRDPKSGQEKVVRNIRTLRLWEYSPVVFGMQPLTRTLAVKSADDTATCTGDGTGETLPEITDALVTEEREFKVGRVLSARNFEAIKQAYELLSSVMQSASLNDGDEPGDEPEKSQHDEHEHKHIPDGPQDAPVTPTSREEAGPLSVPNAPAVSTVELQSKIAQFLTDMEGQS